MTSFSRSSLVMQGLFTFPRISLLLLPCFLWVVGCATDGRKVSGVDTLPNYPIGYVERGVASWYGPGFHGNLTANGERYDMHGLTAAHRTLPLGSVVHVRSLTSGRKVTVRINDRGPFVKDRILDLSFGAAEVLKITRQGTDRVALRVVDYLGPLSNGEVLVVQAGSFSDRNRAWTLKSRIDERYPSVRVVSIHLPEGRRYRVLVGQFRSERQAKALADKLARQFNIETLVIRDDT